ncbi:MAG: carbon-nitrogen hydrolase family protein [Arenicellales bacterium]
MPDTSSLPIFSAIQLNSSDSLNENLETAFSQLKLAKDQGALCALLPETFAWIGEDAKAPLYSEKLGNGAVQSFLADTAKSLGLWIIGGSHRIIVPNDPKQRVTNTTLVYNPQGQQVARYDKIHLFDAEVGEQRAYTESDTFKAGEHICVVDMGFAKVGLSICYDIRFPALYQSLRQQDADIIVVPAAFTVPTGQAHWQALLQARAIENQVYIIAAAQTGQHSTGRETWGHSLCIDPWGKIQGELDHGTGNIQCAINIEKMKQIRHDMPVILHQRSNHYQT